MWAFVPVNCVNVNDSYIKISVKYRENSEGLVLYSEFYLKSSLIRRDFAQIVNKLTAKKQTIREFKPNKQNLPFIKMIFLLFCLLNTTITIFSIY